jgi:hypothetical protein
VEYFFLVMVPYLGIGAALLANVDVLRLALAAGAGILTGVIAGFFMRR